MLKLTQKERDIVFAAQLQATAPVTRIRKVTGYRDHTIRYYLQRALSQGVVRRRCFINLNLLGYTQYQIYFSLSSKKKESRLGLIKALTNSEKVSWLGEVGGDYQYGVNICAKNIREVSDFLDELSGRFGAIFLEKVVAFRISFSYFGNKYLSGKKRTPKTLGYEVSGQALSLDEVDHRILVNITRTDYDSWRHLARLLGMPQTTFDYRLKKLESSGIVVGHYYELQSEAVGMQSYMLLVCAKGFSQKFRELFYEFCLEHPNVVVLIHSIGSWDFEVVVEVEEAQHITAITQAIYDRFGEGLNWVKILPSFGYPKVLEYPFKSWETVKGE